jgi:sialic acid synthase SpsE
MFVISEIFPQHSGNLEVAEQMILQSKLGGADAVKVQLYEAEQFGKERAYLELSKDGLKRLKEYADRLNIPLFATPFTFERLDWCVDLDLPYMKVPARMHRENPDLVNAILDVGKTTFVSVPSDFPLSDISKKENGIYLHCVLKYPTPLDELEVPQFNNAFFDGISDHSIGIAGALFAAARGARYLEKHFTLSKSFQMGTEKAHVGGMTMEDLLLIKSLSREFEFIQSV